MSKIQNISIETKKSLNLSGQNINLSQTNLDYLQISRKSRFVSKVSTCFDNLDVNIDRDKKKLISTRRIISTVFKSKSRHDGRSRSQSRLVSTAKTSNLREYPKYKFRSNFEWLGYFSLKKNKHQVC